jgi:cytochrome c oxidase subunit II
MQSSVRGLERGGFPAIAMGACAMTAAVGLVVLAGCQGRRTQSAMHPGGPDAAAIAWLTWLMTGVFTAVFVLVLVLMVIALFRRGNGGGNRPPLGPRGFIVGGGVALPLLILIPLYVVSLETSAKLRAPTGQLTIRVVGHQWWWEVHYPDHDIVTANEIYIPAGQNVRLELVSADVIHSFWVPSLHGKRDMIPGLMNPFWLRAASPGVYRGQCAEYCGTQHAHMAFHVVALPPERFAGWLEARQRPRPVAAETPESRGQQVFLRAGCARCHAIRGTAARGNLGPDLTHVGSRQSLGAGRLPNTRGNLLGWVADAPSLKPGIHMPKSYLASDDLFDLVTYLESLE